MVIVVILTTVFAGPYVVPYIVHCTSQQNKKKTTCLVPAVSVSVPLAVLYISLLYMSFVHHVTVGMCFWTLKQVQLRKYTYAITCPPT